MQIFERYIVDKAKCEQLKQLFMQDAMLVQYSDMKDNKLNLPEEYMGIYKMGEGLSYITNNDVYFDAKDLHSIETIDNFALRRTGKNFDKVKKELIEDFYCIKMNGLYFREDIETIKLI